MFCLEQEGRKLLFEVYGVSILLLLTCQYCI